MSEQIAKDLEPDCENFHLAKLPDDMQTPPSVGTSRPVVTATIHPTTGESVSRCRRVH